MKDKTMAAKLKNLTGQRFGKLSIIDRAPNRGVRTMWNCQCDCGNNKSISTKSLLRGTSNSCGKCGANSAYFQSKDWKPRHLKQYMRDATKRNYCWELTDEIFFDMIYQDCFYCGNEPLRVPVAYRGAIDPVAINGIDRVDNSQGYTPSNVVACCTECNIAKGAMSAAEFIAMGQRIAARHGLVLGRHAEAGY